MREILAAVMPELTLGLWAVYFAVALGARVAQHRRRTGRTGLIGPRGHSGVAQPLGEGVELLAFVLGVAAPILALADVAEPVDALDTSAVKVLGILLFALGLAGIVVSQRAMGASWRIGLDRRERTDLVTTGPFAVVRHPIFACIVAVQAGLALLVPNVVALVGVALQAVSGQVQARFVEEPHLRRVHGEAYADYARRTGRFVPRIQRRTR